MWRHVSSASLSIGNRQALGLHEILWERDVIILYKLNSDGLDTLRFGQCQHERSAQDGIVGGYKLGGRRWFNKHCCIIQKYFQGSTFSETSHRAKQGKWRKQGKGHSITSQS